MTFFRLTAVAAIATCLVGCRGKCAGDVTPDSPATPVSSTDTGVQPDSAVPEAPSEPASVQSEASSASGTGITLSWNTKRTPIAPRLLWTGKSFVFTWIEVDADELESATIFDDESKRLGLEKTGKVGAVDLSPFESFETYFVVVNPQTDQALDPVLLEGVGSGPKGLDGPYLSTPTWFDHTLALAWVLVNTSGEGGDPGRIVLGRWEADGQAKGDPEIIAKEANVHHVLRQAHSTGLYVETIGKALYVVWASNAQFKTSGCKGEHGDADSIAIHTLELDGTVDTQYYCADVLQDSYVDRLGDGLVVVMHNMHICDHTWIGCYPPDPGCNVDYPGTNEYPTYVFERLLSTGSALLVWYDDYKSYSQNRKRRCLDILLPATAADGPAFECATYLSLGLLWNDAGLHLNLDTKEENHHIPFPQGQHISPALLRNALVKLSPVGDAVWSGDSIAIAWRTPKSVKLRIIGQEDLEAD
jgi:hypothetical protein